MGRQTLTTPQLAMLMACVFAILMLTSHDAWDKTRELIMVINSSMHQILAWISESPLRTAVAVTTFTLAAVLLTGMSVRSKKTFE